MVTNFFPLFNVLIEMPLYSKKHLLRHLNAIWFDATGEAFMSCPDDDRAGEQEMTVDETWCHLCRKPIVMALEKFKDVLACL